MDAGPQRLDSRRLRRLEPAWLLYAVSVAVAAGLSYWLSVAVGLSRAPYLASMGCVLFMQPSVHESIVRAFGRMAGVLLGVAIAVGAVVLVGSNAWSVGLLVLGGLVCAEVLRLGPGGALQVAISGVLVVGAIGADPSYPAQRIVETALGLAVGLLVTVLLARPAVEPAVRATRAVLDGLTELLVDVSRELEEGGRAPAALPERAGRLRREADGAAQRTRAAMESLRWNIRAPKVRQQVSAADALVATLVPLCSRTATMVVLSMEEPRPADPSGPSSPEGPSVRVPMPTFAQLLRHSAEALGRYGSLSLRPPHQGHTPEGTPGLPEIPAAAPSLVHLRDLRAEALRVATERWSAQPERWLRFGIVLSVVDLVLEAIGSAAIAESG